MDELDIWANAASRHGGLWTEAAVRRLETRLLGELSPMETSRRRRAHGLAACICAAAVSGFLTTGVLEWRMQTQPASRWPAAAMDASPSVLLIADRGR